ncbi:MAG: hypothetical protein JSR80_03780 [Verrucomicrobia bacterium]|nr:hypothetical protein [Verrucomicrobiota bacterium]
MENNLSIKVSASQRGIIFTAQTAASIGIGLVASRLFKSFSPAHGAAMGALYGAGASIAIMKTLVIYEILQKKLEIDDRLEKIEPPYIGTLLDKVEAVAKDWTMTTKQHEEISKRFRELISCIPKEYPQALKRRAESIRSSLSTIRLFLNDYKKQNLKDLYKQLDQGIRYLKNREQIDEEINGLETSLKLLDEQLASAGRTMILGLGLAVFLPLLTKRFGFSMNGKILSQFLGAQVGAAVLTNLISGIFMAKNPLAFFQPSSLDQT